MSNDLAHHRAAMKQLAERLVGDFVAQHPDFAIAPDQTGNDSVTNYVMFGTHTRKGTSTRVVFKVFCEDERKAREVYALRHFDPTGLVPALLADVGPRLIVQSFIPGGWPARPNSKGYATWDKGRAGYTLGQATAKLVATPLTAQSARDFERAFYNRQPLEQYLHKVIEAAREIQRVVTTYQADIFADSLARIEAGLPYLLQQPRLLYHQDAMNMHFLGADFVGFFDLEMCRVGTEAMQIGSLWAFLATYQNWPAFAQGFAAVAGRDLEIHDFRAACAFAHFLVWRYITRSGRWHGESEAVGDTQLHTEAEEYAATLRSINRVAFAA